MHNRAKLRNIALFRHTVRLDYHPMSIKPPQLAYLRRVC